MLPVYEQEHPASCVAACVRMVLASHSIFLAEEEICNRCGLTALGLRLFDVPNALSDLAATAEVHTNWGVDDLQDEIRFSNYPIVGIDLRPIDGRFAFHAVVVVKIERDRVTVHDPQPGVGIQTIDLSTFLSAWRSADQQALIISRIKN